MTEGLDVDLPRVQIAEAPLRRAAPVVFSLLLHGVMAVAFFLFTGGGRPPEEEKVYRISLAAFAPARASGDPGQEETPPSPASVQPETPPPPRPGRRAQRRPRDTGTRAEQPPPRTPSPAAKSGATAPEAGGRGAAHPAGEPGVYAEDAVDQRPSISRRVDPEYPERARWRRLQGRVVVQVVVDASGTPRQCSVYASDPAGVFDAAALDAARRTRFIPGRINGRPVATIVLLPYRFSLR